MLKALHGPLKREFIVEQGWIPLEESTEGLVVMCVDPEAMRGSRIVLTCVAVIAVLSELGYPVASLIAGLGLGGIAFALAAQKTVENLFGSVIEQHLSEACA